MILQKNLKEFIIEESEFKESLIFLTDDIKFAEKFY